MTGDARRPARRTLINHYLLLVLPTLMLLDFYGMFMGSAGRHCPVVIAAGLATFACGAAMGVWLAKRTKPRSWSPCYWLIGGLLGATVPIFLLFYLVAALL
jgi:hypothetical protein